MNVEILIVEDEGLIALDLKKRLEQVGYTSTDDDEDAPGEGRVVGPQERSQG